MERNVADRVEEGRDRCDCRGRRWPWAFRLPICKSVRTNGCRKIDARDEGLALARDSGADVIINARQEKKKVIDEVLKLTHGMGADATVNVSDNGQAAALACAVTKMQYVLSELIPFLGQTLSLKRVLLLRTLETRSEA